MNIKRHVEWQPINADGTQWIAWLGKFYRGSVNRLYGGRYATRCSGRRARKFTRTMREAGKELVAFVNSVPPSYIR